MRIVSALTASTNPNYLGDLALELENPMPCAQGVAAKGSFGVWKVSDAVEKKIRDGVRATRE